MTYDKSKNGRYIKEGPTISIAGIVALIPMSRSKKKVPSRLVQPVLGSAMEGCIGFCDNRGGHAHTLTVIITECTVISSYLCSLH